MAIPVRNIYYLLSYAWDRLDPNDRVRVSAEDASNLAELLACILTNGLNQLARRGLERGYLENRDTITVLRGRLCCHETINLMGFHRGRLVCDYEEMTHDTLLNQILKATLRRLLHACPNGQVRRSVAECLHRFHDVDDIALDAAVFSRVVVHRNNQLYGLLIDVCHLAWKNLLPNESSGTWELVDFLRDPRQMGLLFEGFVRNFYRRHRNVTGLDVDHENIAWRWHAMDAAATTFLPQMKTDIRLRNRHRKILIECKFSWITRANQYDDEKFISSHLYQLNAYLTNLPDTPENHTCEAVLLYPAENASVHAHYRDGERHISVRTVDLNQEWKLIERDLLKLLQPDSPNS